MYSVCYHVYGKHELHAPDRRNEIDAFPGGRMHGPPIAKAQHVSISDDSLTVELTEGRTLTVPLGWYPRLLHGTAAERGHWRLIGDGEGIHWPDLDEDLSVEGLLRGRPSGESQRSLKRWLADRAMDIESLPRTE